MFFVNQTKKNCNCRVLIALLVIMGHLLPVDAQEPLLQHFFDYRENNLQEKLFLHTDKPFYLAGEICWFKIYAVDAFLHHPLGMSKLAYVELLDKNNKPVRQAKIALKEGDGNGSFHLPVALASGMYTLRAYTNWMKNTDPAYFFEKTLTVVNTLAIYTPLAKPKKEQLQLQFFPEGGNLVNGLKSKVAFKVMTANGTGVSCNGAILNENGDSVSYCNTLQFGMGSFFLKPEAGHRYRGVMLLPDGSTVVQDLPIASANGYVMSLEATEENQISINVQYAGTAAAASDVYLFVHTRNSVKSVQKNTLQNGAAQFLVDGKKLGEGISHFTVFNAGRQPVCERLYFTYPENQLLPAIATDANEYQTRRKITVHVLSKDQSGVPVAANMSMAVYRLDSLQAPEQADISSYLWLTADLGGCIESPAWYFINKNNGAAPAMDNLMLTNGWRRFSWEDVLQEKKPAFAFVPEYAGHIVTGRITRTATGQPGKNIAAYLSAPGTHTQFRNAVSDTGGIIKFDMKDFYNEGEIIVQTDNLQDSIYMVEVQNPFSEKYNIHPVPVMELSASNAIELAKRSTELQVQNEYSGTRLKQFNNPDADTSSFYVKPDFTYLLDNYTRFTTMEEVLREYVVPVNVRKREGKFHLPVFDELSRQFFINDPLILLDGVAIFDIDKFMTYDPLKIRKLEVLSRRYFLGNMFFEGIVNFVTYKGSLEGYELNPHATVIDYDGLQKQRIFYSPAYETPQQLASHLPDFRNLLYWSPTVKTGAHGLRDISLYSSDITGRYVIVLQGLTADGKTGTATALFEVKE